MRPLKVHREQWTFPELMQHFRLQGDLDLRRLVMGGAIQPMLHFARPLHPASMQEGFPVVDAAEETPVHGWLWIATEHGTQTDNFEGMFSLLRDRPLHDDEAQYFALPEPITLSEILVLSVVADSNVKAIDEAGKDDPDRELSRKEEKTRDKLIAVLAAEHLGWRPWEDGKDMELAGFLVAAKERGLPMSRNCVKDHIKLAWERMEPAMDR